MPKRLKEVDAHIAKAPPFARPILRKIREMFHRGCPQVTEVLKWRMPFFDYKGTLGGMATFKNYVRMGFWKGKLIDEQLGLPKGKGAPRMMSAELTSVDQLPDDKTFLKFVRTAAQINEEGVKSRRPTRKKIPITATKPPADFLEAMKEKPKAFKTFERFPPGARRDYVEWITGAKQPETRSRRIKTAIQWLREGKKYNWQYQKK